MSNEELAVKAQEGDKQAIFELWEQVKKLLYLKAHSLFTRQGTERCARHGVTLNDLRQECYLAFIDALRAYKPQGEYKFTSYLNYASKNRFQACLGIKSTRRDALNYADSLNAPVDEGEDSAELGEMIADPEAEQNIITPIEQSNLTAVIEAELQRLPLIQETILRKRFFEKLSQAATAEALHITVADVRREEGKARIVFIQNKSIQSVWEDSLEASAYRGVGWLTWKERQASVQERLVERRELSA